VTEDRKGNVWFDDNSYLLSRYSLLDGGGDYKNFGGWTYHRQIWRDAYNLQTTFSTWPGLKKDPLGEFSAGDLWDKEPLDRGMRMILGSDWAEGAELADPYVEMDYKRAIYRRQLHPQSLLYHRAIFTGDQALFHDLTIYAPGLNTSTADIQAVLQAEA